LKIACRREVAPRWRGHRACGLTSRLREKHGSYWSKATERWPADDARCPERRRQERPSRRSRNRPYHSGL